MTPARPSQNVRFRTACDPCSTAKVRCDKKHPVCSRCSQLRASCSYSESRKHGRQSWRMRLAYERTMNARTAAEAQLLAMAKPAGPSAVTINETERSSSRVLPSSSLGDGQVWGSLLNYGQQGNSDTSAHLSSWPAIDDLGTEIDSGYFQDWDIADVSQSGPGRSGSPAISRPSLHDALPGTSGSAGEPSPASDVSSTHDCEAQAISILCSMQHGEMHQGAKSCSTTPAHAYADLDFTPSFDRVLAVNKAALNGWGRLMKCSCTQCPHLILLYVSILSKMLFWYRIAATENLRVSDDAKSDDSAQSSDSTATRSYKEKGPSISQFGIHPTPIQVGMLSLSAEDQANVRRVLLLRELGSMEKAIDELTNVDRTAIEEDADEIVRSAVHWSLTGLSRVREELQAVTLKVKQIH